MTETAFDWDSIRAEFEAGASESALARKWGPSRAAIRKRRARDAKAGDPWRQDSEQRIRRATRAKLSGVDKAPDPVTLEKAIADEAGRRAGIIEGHRQLFADCRQLVQEALALRRATMTGRGKSAKKTGGVAVAFDAMKLAKITSEAARNIMVGERLAYGIAEGEERPPTDLADDDRALLESWQRDYAHRDGTPPK